jgi:hypothetical protein
MVRGVGLPGITGSSGSFFFLFSQRAAALTKEKDKEERERGESFKKTAGAE